MRLDWYDGPLSEGLRLYNAGEFFAAHEAWEVVWLRSPEPEKTFLQGLIQVTAALHHLTRENRLGTELLLQAALRRIQFYPPTFGDIYVVSLCDDIRVCLRSLEALEPSRQIQPPKIYPLPRDAPSKSPTGG